MAVPNYKKKTLPLAKLLALSLLGFLLSVQASAQNFGFEFANDRRKKIVVPFEMHNNLIVLPVKLNKGLPLRFILDSGIRTTILTEKLMARALDLTFNRTIELKGPGEKQLVTAHVANGVTIEIEGIVGEGQALLVLEEDYLQLASHLGVEVHGIIGYELFSKFVIEIDYINSLLVFHQGEYFAPKNRWTPLPMQVIDTKPYIAASIAQGDRKSAIRMMIDTGASHAALLEAGEDNNIKVPDKSLRATLGRGLGGEIRGRLGRVDQLALGEFFFNDVIASFPDPEAYADTIFHDRQGTIGGELLMRFKVVFDYSNEMLYLKSNGRYREEFSYDMSGMQVIADGHDLRTFIVSNVRENSPADRAGLMAGDTVLAVNGHRAEYIKLSYIHSLMHSKEGKKIRLVIKRDGVRMRKRFKLEKLI